MEIEKEIVREVVRGDKHNLRKSANRNAQISVIHSAHCTDLKLCFAICRFSQVVFVTSNNFEIWGLRIRGSAFAWMKSFWTSRRQITTVDGCTSAPAEIGAGVPQGAILSPLLSSVHVNDISSATPASNINLFADDTSAYVSSQAPSVLNSDLRLLRTLCRAGSTADIYQFTQPRQCVWSCAQRECPLASLTLKSMATTSHRLLDTASSESSSMNDCHGRITSTMLSKSLPRKLDSSVALAGYCLQPLSGISMHSASGLVSILAALSGVASVPQMLHA